MVGCCIFLGCGVVVICAGLCLGFCFEYGYGSRFVVESRNGPPIDVVLLDVFVPACSGEIQIGSYPG